MFLLFYWERAFLVAQNVKNSPAVQETQVTWVLSLGQEDPLEEGTVTHSCILAWRIPWTGRATVHKVTKSWIQLTEATEHTWAHKVYN